MVRRCCFLLLLSCSFLFADGTTSPKPSSEIGKSDQLPVTTSSSRARTDFEAAMQDFEQYRLNDSLEFLRAATKSDPNFAQAFIMIAKISKDPNEQAEARQRAKQLAAAVSPGEQLLIRWLAGAQEDDYLPAIAAMNDLLGQYPRDARLAFLAGDWLTLQERYHHAAVVLEHALAWDTPTPLVESSRRPSPSWIDMLRWCLMNRTRTIPTVRFCAWMGNSTPLLNSTVSAFVWTLVSVRKWA
jgi:tetratricopeptide (TPR) repeat protein